MTVRAERVRHFVLEQIELRSEPEPNSGCLIWLGSVSNVGYPRLYAKVDGRSQPFHIHRVLAGVAGGDTSMWALHRCDVKRCVNEKHIYAGDHWDNSRDWSRACAEGRSHGRGPDRHPGRTRARRVPERRDKSVYLHFTGTELAVLEQAAQECGEKLATYTRSCALAGHALRQVQA